MVYGAFIFPHSALCVSDGDIKGIYWNYHFAGSRGWGVGLASVGVAIPVH